MTQQKNTYLLAEVKNGAYKNAGNKIIKSNHTYCRFQSLLVT